MNCPKKEILASLIYILRLIDNGDLELKDEVSIEKITKNITELFETAIKNKEKFENNNEDNTINLNMYAKSVFYTMNYLKDKKPINENITSKISLLKNERYEINTNYINTFDKEIVFDFGNDNKTFITEEYLDKLIFSLNFRQKTAKEIMPILNKVTLKYNYQNKNYVPITNYEFENFTLNILEKIKSHIDKFSKDTLFYLNDTEIKIPYIAKEDILELIRNYVKNEIDSKYAKEYLSIKILTEHLDEIENDLAEIIFNNIKIEMNSSITNSIVSLVNGERLISSNIPDFLKPYETLLKMNGTLEFSVNQFDEKIILPNIATEKEKAKENYSPFIELSFYKKETDEDFPLKEKKVNLIPQKVTYEFNLKKKNITIKKIDFDKKTEKIYETNTAQNVSFYIKKDYRNNKFNISVIDEIDKGSTGKINDILRYITENDKKNIIGGSGSPLTSKPRELVSLVAFGNEGVDIEENEKNFTIQCGVFQLKNEYDALIFNGIRNSEEFAKAISKIFDTYFSKVANKNESFNEVMYFFNNTDLLLKILEKEEISDLTALKNIDLFKFSRNLNKIASKFFRNKKLYNPDSLTDSFIKMFLDSHQTFLKEIPEISNPKTLTGLVDSMGHSNPSIMTREALKNRKEVINIFDKEQFFKTLKNIDENILDLKSVKDYNDFGIKLMQVAIDYTNRELFIPQIMEYLTDTFKDFTNMFINDKEKENNLKSLSKLLNIEVNDIKNYLQKTTISGIDDINNIYVKYLKFNGNFEKLKKEFVKDEYSAKKINFFKKFLKVYDVYFQALPKFINEAEKNNLIINGNTFTKTGNYKYQSVFKIGGGKNVKELSTDVLKPQLGYPKELNVLFSIEVELGKEIYKQFFKPLKDENGKEYYLKYNLEFTNPEENMVLDVRASKGIQKVIQNELNNEKSVVISSSRVAGLVFNLLDTIYSAQFRKNKDIPLSIIVNETASQNDFNLKDIISRIDENYLKENNIVITPVKRNMLDAQVKLDKEKGYQIALLSNYESVSRGLDLSMLDTMIATGAMTKGKEFIQYLSRLFSVTKDSANISLFHGGKDIDLFIREDLPKDIISKIGNILRGKIDEETAWKLIEQYQDRFLVKSSQTSKIQADNIKKLDVYKIFMSGQKTNLNEVENTQKNSIVEVIDNEIEKELQSGESINIMNKTKIKA